MKTPKHATDYDHRGVAAAYAVLIELGQILGEYRDDLVVIGGMVPALMIPDAVPKHIGTLDIDLGLNPDGLTDDRYVSLVMALKNEGYLQGEEAEGRPFQLFRDIDLGDGGEMVRVTVEVLISREVQLESKAVPTLKGFAVQKVDGITTALEHRREVDVEGTMPDGRKNSVPVLVATIPALLVMKGYALTKRNKEKDAYDIYYSIRNYPGGAEKLGFECRQLLGDKIAKEGYTRIASKFRNAEDFGPGTVRRFLEGSGAMGSMTAAQIEVDAYQQVTAWLRGLGFRD